MCATPVHNYPDSAKLGNLEFTFNVNREIIRRRVIVGYHQSFKLRHHCLFSVDFKGNDYWAAAPRFYSSSNLVSFKLGNLGKVRQFRIYV